MLTIAKNLYDYRELVAELTRKNITVRYKQAYLGIAWAVLRPLAGRIVRLKLRKDHYSEI